MTKLAYLNDQFLREDEASISIFDLSVQRGYAIFDFFRLIGNQPLHLDDHLDRFYSSAGQMHLPVPKKREEIKQIVQEMIRENELPNTGIRLQLTGGDYTDGSEFTSPTFFLSQLKFPLPSPSMRENGIRLVSYGHQRQLPEVKSTDYLMSIWLQPFLRAQHADDILYHANGLITECPRSNFFIVTNDLRVITPSKRILKGITRMKLMQLASGNFEVEERDITLAEIFNAKEAFVTSTTKQIIAVSSIDGEKIGNGLPGEVTMMLTNKLNEYCGFNL